MIKLERIILKSRPIAFILHKSKGIVLPGFEGVPLYDASVFFIRQLKNVSITERASAISFNFVMAVPAAFICIFTIIPYMPISERFRAELLELTRQITRNQEAYNFVNNFLTDYLDNPRVGLLSFGFILVIFYASNAMLGVIRTFDKSIYQYKVKTNFIKKRWKAIKMTVVMFGLIIGMVLLLIGQGILFDKVMDWLNITGSNILLIKIVRWLLSIGLFFYGISYIYKYGPSVNKRWHTFSPGSILATLLTIVTTYGFSFYVNHFGNYNKIYGSIGTVLILMLLIYLNSLILLIGFELNVSITFLKAAAEERRQKELSSLIEKQVLPNLSK
ncbi:MAG: YihY/virulence factor BrkB family protein [Segetibacter sp.]|nr:YihY/virulence factor BrkB family protein [Segetibacter sp.]